MIYYIFENRLISEKASSYQVFKVIDAIIESGHKVELIYGNRDEQEISEIKKKYLLTKYEISNLPKFTKIKKKDLSSLSYKLLKTTKLQFLLSFIDYFLFLNKLNKIINKKNNIIYLRNVYLYILLQLILPNKKISKLVLEIHNPINSKIVNFLLKLSFNKIYPVFICEGLKEKFISKGLINNNSIVAHDGVDINKVKKEKDIVETPIKVLYIGNFESNNISKGIHEFIDFISQIKSFKHDDYIFKFVGANKIQKANLDKKVLEYGLKNIEIHLKIDLYEYDNYFSWANVLLIPNPKIPYFNYSSPLKLFQYISQYKPILSTNLDCIKELLPDEIYYFNYNSKDSLIKSLNDIKQKKINFSNKYDFIIKNYSWLNRQKKILDPLFIH